MYVRGQVWAFIWKAVGSYLNTGGLPCPGQTSYCLKLELYPNDLREETNGHLWDSMGQQHGGTITPLETQTVLPSWTAIGQTLLLEEIHVRGTHQNIWLSVWRAKAQTFTSFLTHILHFLLYWVTGRKMGTTEACFCFHFIALWV